MNDNYPAGSKNDLSAPYNYDPEQTLVECENCDEFIIVAIAVVWNGSNFCDDYCLQRYLDE